MPGGGPLQRPISGSGDYGFYCLFVQSSYEWISSSNIFICGTMAIVWVECGCGPSGSYHNRRSDGTTSWSLSILRRTLCHEGIVRVGTSAMRRVLRDAGSSFQRARSWCPTGTAQRVRKSGVVKGVNPGSERKRRHIELAYRLPEADGIPVWCVKTTTTASSGKRAGSAASSPASCSMTH